MNGRPPQHPASTQIVREAEATLRKLGMDVEELRMDVALAYYNRAFIPNDDVRSPIRALRTVVLDEVAHIASEQRPLVPQGPEAPLELIAIKID